ncbi:glycoside hydrolase family 57 protein [Porphyromonadaceae bacterium W3.11]|nr:glycoside hydrolase family 57 protein [Porphyromonadaceae bacterium W3.11]
MKKKVCIIFQIHQPFRLKRYRFFDIGNDHYYFDDLQDEEIFRRATEESYIPALEMLKEQIEATNGAFKVAFSISGTALDQMEMYAPDMIDRLLDLHKAGEVEFLGEPHAHGLSSLFFDKGEFRSQIKRHASKIQLMFGKRPSVFRNSDLIFDDSIAETLVDLGFKGVITEGAEQLLGWKSPNFLYESAAKPGLNLILRNQRFTEDITKNFGRQDWADFPLTADKFASWLASTPEDEELITLDMSLDTLGLAQPAHTGIFDFFRALPKYILDSGLEFVTPSGALDTLKPKDQLVVSEAISWSEKEKNTLSWLGNVLQKEAFAKLEQWSERTRLVGDRSILQDWLYLQSSDHFLYMSTMNSDAWRFSPYDSAYDAFSNYMNVLSDFLLRVEAQYPSSIENEELAALLTTIRNQDEKISQLQKELKKKKSSVK